jgi:HK97 family phage major capsid protein
MPATVNSKKNRAALIAHAQAFIKEHEDDKGLLSVEDQATFDAMMAAANALEGGGFIRQADLDGNPREVSGIGQGTALVDEQGRVRRALTRKESYVDAVRENPKLFGVTPNQEKYVDDGLTLGGFLRAIVAGPQTSAERWAMSESNSTSGGYSVPSILAASFIDRFRANTVVLKAGAQTLPLGSADHSFARLTGDATPTWRQETVAIAESDPTLGKLTFYPKSLAVIVKATRELLQDSPNAGEMINRSLTEGFSVEVDRVALLGTGAAAEPMGLRNEPDINEITGVGALGDYSDYVDAIKLLMDDNVPTDDLAAIVSNRDWATLAKLEDSTGQPLMLPPAVKDLPFLSTSAIPTNLGGGTNESLSFVGYFADLILGMRAELQIDTLRELFAETHHVGYVAHLRMDTGVFHRESFCRLLGITP